MGKGQAGHWLASDSSRHTSSQNVPASTTDNVSIDAGKLADSKVGKSVFFPPTVMRERYRPGWDEGKREWQHLERREGVK